MADHIPFVTGDDAAASLARLYSDSAVVRVSLDRADRHCPRLQSMRLWLDPGIDGWTTLPTRRPEWKDFITGFPNLAKVGAPRIPLETSCTRGRWLRRGGHGQVRRVQVRRMDHGAAAPAGRWGGPQQDQPRARGGGRQWRSEKGFPGHLILPLVFTNQRQTNKKTERNPKVAQALQCYRLAHADGLWVVEMRA